MELTAHSAVESVRVHLNTKTVDVVGSFATQEEAREQLAPLLAPHGYTLANNATVSLFEPSPLPLPSSHFFYFFSHLGSQARSATAQ